MQKEKSALIFEIENDNKLLDFTTYDNVPIWMLSRWYLLHDIVGGKLLGYKSPDRVRGINKKTINYLGRAFVHNMLNCSKQNNKEILLYSTNRKTFFNGKFFNRYVDQLYLEFQNESCIVEQATLEWDWPFPRTSTNVYFDACAQVCGACVSSVYYKRDYESVYEMLRYFSRRVYKIAGLLFSNEEIHGYAVSISKFIVRMRYMARWMKKMLPQSIKVVIIVGAGFPYYYFMNQALKEKKIVSVELQHGYINGNNIMYNYADAIVNDERVKKGLPDYMLTYGEWWSNQINCPLTKVSIGNPYRQLCMENIKHVSKDNRNLVVIGIGENTEKYIEFVKKICEKFPQYNVKFRPHPGERDVAVNVINKMDYEIILDNNIDIYETLANTSVIIGEVSTVLFEAIGIVNSIFLWNTEYSKTYLPKHPFKCFETIEELEKLVNSNLEVDGDSGLFWTENWNKKYSEFIQKVIN